MFNMLHNFKANAERLVCTITYHASTFIQDGLKCNDHSTCKSSPVMIFVGRKERFIAIIGSIILLRDFSPAWIHIWLHCSLIGSEGGSGQPRRWQLCENSEWRFPCQIIYPCCVRIWLVVIMFVDVPMHFVDHTVINQY